MPAPVAGIFRLGYPSIVWKGGLFWLMTGGVARALHHCFQTLRNLLPVF